VHRLQEQLEERDKEQQHQERDDRGDHRDQPCLGPGETPHGDEKQCWRVGEGDRAPAYAIVAAGSITTNWVMASRGRWRKVD
jgi:hypothetical protein